MSDNLNTPNTPIQFANEDRLLLRQMFTMMQDFNARLTSLEEKSARTTPDLMTMFAEILKAELEPLKEHLGRLEVEIRDLRRTFHATYTELTNVQDTLEDRVTKLERRPRQ